MTTSDNETEEKQPKTNQSNLNDKSSDTNMLKETIEMIANDAQYMPHSAEKLMLNLTWKLMILKNDLTEMMPSIITTKDKGIDNESLLNELDELEKLKSRLASEAEVNAQDVTASLTRIKSAIVATKWLLASTELATLMKLVRPVDMEEMFRLIEKTKEAAKKIENRDVLLLLGKTGSGKSTTAHYLGGSKMKYDEKKRHYEPEQINNRDLFEIKTNASSNSETRFLSPVEIDLYSVLKRREAVLLCDTPGFDDSAGVEVDVANAFGIIEAIHKAKSVRSLVLLSQKGLNDKLDGVARFIAHELIRLTWLISKNRFKKELH
jgi:ABC-type glutathione transport system ATPase component